MAKRDLSIAYERVEPPSARFHEALLGASHDCEEAMGLSAHYDGDSTYMAVAEGLLRTAQGLVRQMRQHPTPAHEDE